MATPEQLLHDLLAATRDFAASALPPAAGSAVSAWLKPGLSWGARLQQFAVGIVVSYYVMAAVQAVMDLDPFIANAAGFSAGLIAFDLLPKLRASLLEAAGDLLPRLTAIFRRKGPDA